MTRSSTDSVVAVPSANDPAGDQQLRRLLHVWSLTAVAVRQPGYYEELTAARAGTATTVPVTEAIPGWAMAEVIDYPDDPLRTFPTSDPNVRRVEFGEAGLITHLISDGARLVIILDTPRAG
jgi:hypothetical protein